MRAKIILAALLVASSFGTMSVAADGLSLGLVVGTAQSAYIGRGQVTGIAPVFRYEGARFSIGSDGLGVKVLDGPTQKLSFHLAPRLSPLKSPSEPQLAGITRDHSLDLAISHEYRSSERFGIATRVSKGISAAQNGVEVKVALRGAVSAGPLPLLVSAGAAWQSAELGQYYYGVNAGEVAVGRPAYTVGASTTPFVSVGSSVPLGDNARLFGSVNAAFLGSAITNSPIVVRSTVVRAAFGMRYSF